MKSKVIIPHGILNMFVKSVAISKKIFFTEIENDAANATSYHEVFLIVHHHSTYDNKMSK